MELTNVPYSHSAHMYVVESVFHNRYGRQRILILIKSKLHGLVAPQAALSPIYATICLLYRCRYGLY